MTTISIIVERSSLQRSSSGQVTGVIWTAVGRTAYPDESWNDFVVIVLGWWMQELLKGLAGEQVLKLRFMDGPYSLELTRTNGRTFSIVARDPHDEGFLDAVINLSDLVGQLLDAGTRVLAECEHRGWQSRDITTLTDAISSLRARASGLV